MYEEPILSENQVADSYAVEDTNLDSNVDANDRYSQEAVKSKKEEDDQYKMQSGKLILRWGLVFTFFR
jgi:hypothetical protein